MQTADAAGKGENMSEYIGNRIVPHHDGVWDKAKEYEPLTIVYEESTGDSYMSRKPVPAGTLLSQEEYWAKLFVTVWSVQDWKVKPSPF